MQPRLLLTMLLIFSPGLLILDHLHFQYNGALSGLFLLSVVCMMEQRFVAAAILFSVLLHLKHMYLYVAPAVFVLMLRRHSFDRHLNFQVRNFASLAVCVTAVTVLSIGPFVQQVPQLMQRLFPFKRGLTHAYWAPNVWALYNAIDFILAKCLLVQTAPAPYTTGLVQDFGHMVLPSIGPAVTFVLTIGVMSPALMHLWHTVCFTPQPEILFVRVLVLCSLSSFLCAWHVHEKAILMSIVPLTLVTLVSAEDASSWILLTTAGSVSLFPLLIQSAETSVKILLMLAYLSYALPALAFYFAPPSVLLKSWQKAYLVALLTLQLVMPVTGLQTRLPFAPLALTSLSCLPGVLLPFLTIYRNTLSMK